MAHVRGTAVAGRWPLRGFWRIWLWVSAAIAAVLALAGIGLAVVVTRAPAAIAAALVVGGAGPLLACAGLIGWQVVRTVREVVLLDDGSVRLTLVGRRLSLRAVDVRRVRYSALVSTHTPVVMETASGSPVLLHPVPEVDALVAALRRFHPQLADDR